MSFLTGMLSGAVLAGGVYYSFSYRLRTGVIQYKTSLHELSERMTNPQTGIEVPPPAAERIVSPAPFNALVKQRWNEQIQSIFQKTVDWRRRD